MVPVDSSRISKSILVTGKQLYVDNQLNNKVGRFVIHIVNNMKTMFWIDHNISMTSLLFID